MPERLQKVLARAGVASRRASEELIAAGRVAVNGRTAQIGQQVDEATDAITVDGKPVGRPATTVHFAIHKPRGLVSSSRAERGRRSVVSLVPYRSGRLWPAGRLDVESEGLMVLTNDGEWANRLLHPRYGLEREYAVLLARDPDEADLRQLAAGVQLEDGRAHLLGSRRASPPDEVAGADVPGTWLRVRLGEGRKREVRRLFAAVGLRIERLVRTRFGSLTLADLPSGAWRELSADEVAELAGSPSQPRDREERPRMRIAIDGPSGSGKSTIGHALAQQLGATFVDTGLMYRALTLAAIERGADPDDEAALERLAGEMPITVRRPRRDAPGRRETVLLGGRDVTDDLRTPRVDNAVSAVSRHAAVRAAMLGVQRRTAGRGTTVMVGRDIGTVVLPDAELKVYLTASKDVRAERRAAEMGAPERLDEYLAELERRDAADSEREVAPLRMASDALLLDTGELSVEACVDRIVAARRDRPA